jgi:hypothetical protein
MTVEQIIAAIPNNKSIDQYWISWHETLKSTFGKKKANKAFLVAFAYRGGSGAKTIDLFNYGKSQGMELETNLLGDAQRIIAGVQEEVTSAFGKLGRIFKVGRVAVVIIIILILVPVFMLLFNIARNPNAAIGAASQGAAKGMV